MATFPNANPHGARRVSPKTLWITHARSSRKKLFRQFGGGLSIASICRAYKTSHSGRGRVGSTIYESRRPNLNAVREKLSNGKNVRNHAEERVLSPHHCSYRFAWVFCFWDAFLFLTNSARASIPSFVPKSLTSW